MSINNPLTRDLGLWRLCCVQVLPCIPVWMWSTVRINVAYQVNMWIIFVSVANCKTLTAWLIKAFSDVSYWDWDMPAFLIVSFCHHFILYSHIWHVCMTRFWSQCFTYSRTIEPYMFWMKRPFCLSAEHSQPTSPVYQWLRHTYPAPNTTDYLQYLCTVQKKR